MNHRTVVCAVLVALCLGMCAASVHAADLRYPVAFDDRSGPVYYHGAGLLDSTPITTVSTSYRLDTAASEPAPTYVPPASTYNGPAYSQVAPVYPQPVTVPAQTAAPTYVQPNYVRQTVTTTYTPARTTYASNATYTPRATYAGTINYVPRATCSPTCVTTYRTPVCQTSAPVATGPRVYVRPKVYVEGQPIRNLLRAITP